MKIKDQKLNSAFNDFTVTSILENDELIKQKATQLSVHTTDEKYLVLSNEFGYFNKLTQFIVGNESSILFLDNNGVQCAPTIKEVQKSPKNYFIMYPIPAYNIETNDDFELTVDKELFGIKKSYQQTVELSFDFGINVGKKFAAYKDYNNNVELNEIDNAINGSRDKRFFWPDKNIIINSNINFCLGILIGYLKFFEDTNSIKDNFFYIHENDNVYIFATLLNYLGANYNIHNLKTKKIDTNIILDKAITLKLPHIYEEILLGIKHPIITDELIKQLIRKTEWLQNTKNQIRKFQTSSFKNREDRLAPTILNNNILTKGLLLIPITNIKFIKVKDTEAEIYDLSMDRADATNYALPFTPILKNSDGDILTLSTAFSVEALEDAKVFEPSSKEWFRNLNDGSVNKYIKDDALLGLYALTKHL